MPLPTSLTTVTRFSKLFALWLYIFLPFAGFYLGMQYQKQTSLSDGAYYMNTVGKGDGSGTYLMNHPPTPTQEVVKDNLLTLTELGTGGGMEETYQVTGRTILPLPGTAKAIRVSAQPSTYTITLNSSSYILTIDGSVGGLCNPNDFGKTCTYTDEEITTPTVHISPLRIWRKNNSVFALNPQSISIGNSTISHLIITKQDATTVFTTTEVSQWKQLLQSIYISSTIPTPTISNTKACTMEAMLCPDGSYVSRTGPNCEFAPCKK